MTLLGMLAVLVLALGGGASYVIARRIGRDITVATNAADALATGQEPVLPPTSVDEMQRLELPIGRMMHEFLSGGVTYPWTLLMSAGIGAVVLATPLIVGTEPPLYFSDHVVGCLAVTIAISALAEAIRAVRLLNVPLGLWLAASPFLLDGGSTAGMIADVALGLALAWVATGATTASPSGFGYTVRCNREPGIERNWRMARSRWSSRCGRWASVPATRSS